MSIQPEAHPIRLAAADREPETATRARTLEPLAEPGMPLGAPSFSSAQDRATEADLQYLGIEINDTEPLAGDHSALQAGIILLLALVFLLDLRFTRQVNVTTLYVIAIFMTLGLKRVQWVLGVTGVSVILNLVSIRYHQLYPYSDLTWRPLHTSLNHFLVAVGAQVPAGILAYRTLIAQRRLERSRLEAMSRQRDLFERERAARTAEQEAMRRELAATNELRAHAAELRRTIESEREARRRATEAVGERDHLRRLTERFQRTLLPTLPRVTGSGHLALGSLYQPAIQEMQMGGDFYDAMYLPNGLVGLVIGDVAGHGVEAAAQTALVTSTLRAFATESPEFPASVLARVNHTLTLDRQFKHFVSLFYGVYDPATSRLRYVNAGHEPPVLLRADGTYEALGPSGLVIGVEDKSEYDEEERTLAVGDALALFTDGITEARDAVTREMLTWDGIASMAREFQASAIAAGAWTQKGSEAAIGLAEHLYQRVLQFASASDQPGAGLADDVALLTVLRIDA